MLQRQKMIYCYGKTAYARGQLLTGTKMGNNEIEEVYGMVAEGYLEKQFSIAMGEPPDEQPKTISRKIIAFSQNNLFMVSVASSTAIWNTSTTADKNSDYYIESFPVNDNGAFYTATTGTGGETTYKKYRYTKEELGINENEYVANIKFGSPGLQGDSKKCLLIIHTYTDDGSNKNKNNLHLYTYHLEENGVIGKVHDSETGIIENLSINLGTITENDVDFALNNFDIISNPLKSEMFYLVGFKTKAYNDLTIGIKRCLVSPTLNNSSISWNLTLESLIFKDISRNTTDMYRIGSIEITSDARYIILGKNTVSDTTGVCIIRLNTDGYPVAILNTQTQGVNGVITILNNMDILLCIQTNKILVYNIIYDNGQTLSLTQIKSLNINTGHYGFISPSFSTGDNTYAIVTGKRENSIRSQTDLVIFNIEEILTEENGETLHNVEIKALAYQEEPTTYAPSAFLYSITHNYGGDLLRIFIHGILNIHNSVYTPYINSTAIETSESLIGTLDNQNMIGVKYKNELYLRMKPQILSAGGGDVRSGKTFIGWQGTIETGTLEV